jgi:hypothetical protein
MGPIALFDKSFIQSLSVDESVWFDKFFIALVCPIFFVETLADLSKTPREGRTPETEVRIIASKFPEMSGSPCAGHLDLCFHNLMGGEVPMEGRIPLTGGRVVKDGNRYGSVHDQSPEAAAFHRWQREQFADLERLFAAKWRASLEATNLEAIAEAFRVHGITPQSCKSISDAHRIANNIVSSPGKKFEQLVLAVRLLGAQGCSTLTTRLD